MSTVLLRARILAVSVSILSANALAIPAYAAADKSAPSGTMLIPLEPRLDDSANSAPSLAPVVKFLPPVPKKIVVAKPPVAAPAAKPAAKQQAAAPRRIASKSVSPVQTAPNAEIHQAQQEPKPPSAVSSAPDVNTAVPALTPIEGAVGDGSMSQEPVGGTALDPIIDENSLLKGTVQIVADDTEYDQEKNTFLGTGNAVAIIAGQNSKLEADTILYDQNAQTIDARGNVKITRDGQLTTGSSFKFKVDSDEYLVTDPDTELQGTQVIARIAKGTNDALTFKKGQFTLPQVVHLSNTANAGPVSFQERGAELKQHPDAYLEKQSFTFTARKMVYEKYKEDGNLTVFGGKLKFAHFTVPLGRFTATAGNDSRVVFPVTPLIGNNMNVGGINLGPQFNYAVGKDGVFSWAPLLQIGGRSVYDTTNTAQNNGRLGAGARIAYSTQKLQAHLNYGSVSNLVVADFKYRFNKRTLFQSGVNRFLNDGIFGNRRARLAAEFVDMRNISTIPYLAALSFRSSAGVFQDQPQLVQLQGSQYSQLFNTNGKTTKTGAARIEEQITVVTHPFLSVGNEKYGMKLSGYAGAAVRAYSTGDAMAMGQFGPVLYVKADRFRMNAGYTQSGVSGKSPFVFDQFIQGQRSTYLSADVRISKWLTLGTNLGYNLNNHMLYSRGFTAAIGPDDIKFLVSRDTISGINRFGFDVVYGSPVKFDTLRLKAHPDAGFGGI